MSETPLFAEIAVPVPLDRTFTWSVPPSMAPEISVGMRVRVPFGGRLLTGVVLALGSEEPEGFDAKAISALLDEAPPVPSTILDLARFVADHYIAPIGEVLKCALPPALSRTGERGWKPTEKGASSASTLEGIEREIVEQLLVQGRATRSELREKIGRAGVPAALDRLEEGGFVRPDDRWSDSKGGRWEKGVSLRPVDAAAIAKACGRSVARARVVERLVALGRPALVDELCREASCTAAVVRALEKGGILASFSQPRRYDLSAAWMSPAGGTACGALVLTSDQQVALDAILSEPPRSFLLQGVTGSGKSEVYGRALEELVRRGGKGIWLVPEIALTPVFARSLEKRFGRRLAVLHSSLSVGERSSEWRRIRDGEVDVVLGPRSAIWAPVEPLGLVVVDEEHDSSYKQEETPRYSARDLALWRGRAEGTRVVLGSATPSAESAQGAREGRLERLLLPNRIENRPLPRVELVDLREEKADPGDRGAIVFSRRLREAIDERMRLGEQALILLNRRGYSPHLVCRGCSEQFLCPDCSIARTYHKRVSLLVCHYCGRKGPAPERCPACGGAVLHPEGVGTERVLEKVRALWPDSPSDRLDRDVARRRGAVTDLLDRFGRGEIRILVGTQMIAKGHHFPNVTLTGVITADGPLSFPDFRAGERTFQLLVQVAGRAGRGSRPGEVVLQSFHPDHPAIRHAAAGRVDDFLEDELRLRRAFAFPPFTRMIRIVVSSSDRAVALAEAERIGREISARAGKEPIRLLGPAPAPLERIKGRWRFHVILRGTNRKFLRRLASASVGSMTPGSGKGPDRVIDVDPQDLL
jgi:primosomal protein N' (replication factor Y)